MENYQILHLIGEGCFGKVFKGRLKYTGQAVALKFITTRGKTEKDLKNLRQEISILKTLKHENIIRLIDAFETASDFVVVTEFGHGELFEIFQDDRHLPESEVQLIAQQLVKALHYLHSNRVIHRDMKPQNILIGSNIIIKVCDFGFARSMSSKTVVLNSVKGTPLYMAPELVQEKPYNHTADLWSMGVILYELFVGTPPFYTNSLYSLINLIINDTVKYPETMSVDFKSFLQGLLQKNPDKRLTWPALLDHPFVAASAGIKSISAPVSAAPSTAVSTPRNSESVRLALREIERGFDSRRPPTDPDIIIECLNVLNTVSQSDSPQLGSREVGFVVEFLIGFLQHVGDQISITGSPSPDPLFATLSTHSAEGIRNVLSIMDNTSSSELMSQLLRLVGLWLREMTASTAPTVLEERVRDDFHIILLRRVTSLFSQQVTAVRSATAVQVNACKCVSVVFTSLSVGTSGRVTQYLTRENPKIFQIVIAKLAEFVLAAATGGGEVSRLSRSALHALSAIVVAGRIRDGAKDHPSPWATTAGGSVGPTAPTNEFDGLTSLKSAIFSSSSPIAGDAFIQAVCAHLLILPSMNGSSVSPRSERLVGTVDAAAVQLLHIFSTDISDSNKFRVTHHLFPNTASTSPPNLLKACFPSSTSSLHTTDVISHCQSAALVTLFLRTTDLPADRMQWLTSDFVLGLTTTFLAQRKQPPTDTHSNPWVFAYSVSLIFELVKKVTSPTSGSRSQLRLNDVVSESLIPVVLAESVRCWQEFGKTTDRRRIEARATGYLSNGPLDGLLGVCNLSPSASGCRRMIRGLLGISESGIRGVIALCGPGGLVELSECVATALMSTSSKDSSYGLVKELLAVLQSLVKYADHVGSPQTPPEFRRAFNLLLDAMVFLCSSTETSSMPEDMLEALAGGNFIPGLISAVTQHFAPPTRSSVSVLAMLVVQPNAVTQFVNAKGLDVILKRYGLLSLASSSSADVAVVSESVSIVSNVARSGSEFYLAIHEQLAPYAEFRRLLSSDRLPAIRAKVCNAIGNMSRHNDFFYPHLAPLVPLLTHACTDESDVNVRKFASFAIGNIAFHSASLYPDLRASIGVLVSLLHDVDEKTRANAAGALGNLVRNSSVLVPVMVSKHAVDELLGIVSGGGGMDSSGRIALFSLGNLAMHAHSREVLTNLRAAEIARKVGAAAKAAKDMQTVKYCDRLLLKLTPPPAAQAGDRNRP